MDDFTENMSFTYDLIVVVFLITLACVGLSQKLGGAEEKEYQGWSYDQTDKCWYSAAENGDRVLEACPMKGTVTE